VLCSGQSPIRKRKGRKGVRWALFLYLLRGTQDHRFRLLILILA
jgi:hypothetical protein